MISALKYKIGKLLDSNIVLSHKVYEILVRLPFLLPHDPSYQAFTLFNRSRVILDVGANNGISALSLNRLFPDAHIISLEPNPMHKPSLQRVQRKLKSFNFRLLGAGNKEGSITFYLPWYQGAPIHTAVSCDLDFLKAQLSSIGVPVSEVRFEEIESKVVTIDSLSAKPDLIKIDCEGFELEILEGAKKTIASSKPMILTEYSSALKGASHKEALWKLLDELDYQAFSYDVASHSLLPFSDAAYASSTGSRNIVLVHSEEL